MLFVINLLRRLLSDPPQRQLFFFFFFLHAYPSASLHSFTWFPPSQNSQLQKSTFWTLLKRRLWQGLSCLCLFPRNFFFVVCFPLYPPTCTHHYTLLDLACLENIWKMSLLEGGCPISITIHTSSNWINRSMIVRLKSHFSLQGFLASPYFPSSHLSLPSRCSNIFLLSFLEQIRYPLSTDDRKRSNTSVISLPGLTKSNFLLANCEAL